MDEAGAFANTRGTAVTILDEAARRARAYLEGLDQRKVRPEQAAIEGLRELNEPLPEHPTSPSATLELLDRLISPATMALAGRRFFGFVCGGSLPAALAANWL